MTEQDEPLLDIDLLAEHASITKLEIDKPVGSQSPIVMTMRVETGPIEMDDLAFLIPPGEPFVFWNEHGDLEDNAPKLMDMRYKTKRKHYIVVDEAVNFVGHQFAGFKATPSGNRRLMVGFATKIIEPAQELIVKMAHRLKSPIRFEIKGRVPEAQMDLEL